MPVFCIAYGCDNHQRSASSEVSFHRLPLKKPALLKQVRIFSVTVIVYLKRATLLSSPNSG